MVKLQNSYLGFTNVSTMQGGKKANALDKMMNFGGSIGIKTRKEFIANYLFDNECKLEMEENYQTYKRDGELTKPKTAYRLKNDDDTFYDITKTEYDFAIYILKMFPSKESIIKYIEDESKIAEEEKVKNEQQKENERIIIEKEQEEKERLRKDRIAKWIEQGDMLLTEKEKRIFSEYFDKNIEEIYIEHNLNVGELKINFMNRVKMQFGNPKQLLSDFNFYKYRMDKNKNDKYSIDDHLRNIYENLMDIDFSDSNTKIENKVKKYFEAK